MKASVLDLRRHMKDVLRALDRNEKVTLLYRGRKKAVIHPLGDEERPPLRVSEHPAFGMWSGRKDMKDVGRAVRNLRKGRGHAL